MTFRIFRLILISSVIICMAEADISTSDIPTPTPTPSSGSGPGSAFGSSSGESENGKEIKVDESNQVGKFVMKLISRESHCTTLFYRDGLNAHGNAELISELGNAVGGGGGGGKMASAYYNVNVHSYPEGSLESLNTSRSKSRVGNYSNILHKGKFSTSATTRKSDGCKLVILMLWDIRPRTLKQIHKMLTPVHLPITHKGRDHYVFVTNEDLMNELLQREFPARIKYKLAVAAATGHSGQSGGILVKSVCFCCNEGGAGQGRIVSYPVAVGHPDDVDVVVNVNFNYFPDYLLNLNGRLLRVVTQSYTGRVEVDARKQFPLRNNAKRGMWKSFIEEYLMIKLNFTYWMFVATGKNGKTGTGGSGLELPNGTWIGCVGDVAAGKADFTIGLAASYKRVEQIEFTSSFLDVTYLVFTTSHGDRIYSPLTLLVWPFDILMWTLIALSTVLVCIAFTLLTRYMDYLYMWRWRDGDGEAKDKNPNVNVLSFSRRGITSKDNWSFGRQLTFIGSSYLEQDAQLPTFTPLRCLVALWLFFVLVVTTVYRAKMTSLLAFPIYSYPPETFKDLAYSDYQVGFVRHGDSAATMFKTSKDAVYRKLSNEMEMFYGTGIGCLERIFSNSKSYKYKRYACIAYITSVTNVIASNLSKSDARKLVVAPETTYTIFLGLAFEGGSIYKEGFEKWLSWARPMNLHQLWNDWDAEHNRKRAKREWWAKTNQTDKLNDSGGGDEGDIALALAFRNVSGAFYIIFGGFLVSIATFLQEMIRSGYFRTFLQKWRITSAC